MQDLGEEEDDLERMFEDEELDEELFAHQGNPCNGLRRQGNIGDTQVFGSAPIMAPQGKFQLWNSDVLVSKQSSMKNCASESLQRSQSQNQAGPITTQPVAPKIEIKALPAPPLIKVNFNNSLP